MLAFTETQFKSLGLRFAQIQMHGKGFEEVKLAVWGKGCVLSWG